MSFKRMAVALIAVVTAVLGLSLVSAGPAAAATGAWVTYGRKNPITSSESTWTCGPSAKIETSVGAQACAIRAPGGLYVQMAVIVLNNRTTTYAAEAAAQLWDWNNPVRIGAWECGRKALAANGWSVCFGQSISYNAPVYLHVGGVNGVFLNGSTTPS